MKQGKISRIIGPVVDVRFASGDLPPVLGALRIESPQGPRIVEVHEHLDQITVRGIVMSPTWTPALRSLYRPDVAREDECLTPSAPRSTAWAS